VRVAARGEPAPSLLGGPTGLARLAALPRWCAQAFEQLDRKPLRERAALLALACAALLAIEALLVLPQRDRRSSVAGALAAEQQAAQEAEQTDLAQHQAEDQALRERLAHVEQQLRQRGADASRGDTLAGWLRRALIDQPVRVVALRGLGTQELEPPATATAADSTSPPAAAAAAHAPALYRHRYEITLAGEVNELHAAVQLLGERIAPLRIERVRLWSADGKAVQATLGFVVVTSERTWISL